MNIDAIILIIWAHTVSDFVFQSDEVAINKSSNIFYLIRHCLIYSILFMFLNFTFAGFNCIMHFIVDYVSSKFTSYFHKNNKRHWFFVTVGIDQAIHLTILILSYKYLIGE